MGRLLALKVVKSVKRPKVAATQFCTSVGDSRTLLQHSTFHTCVMHVNGEDMVCSKMVQKQIRQSKSACTDDAHDPVFVPFILNAMPLPCVSVYVMETDWCSRLKNTGQPWLFKGQGTL